jgi:hypothetical protein
MDLQMENKKKLRIIQFYGVSGPLYVKYKNEIKELHKKLILIIEDGKSTPIRNYINGRF